MIELYRLRKIYGINTLKKEIDKSLSLKRKEAIKQNNDTFIKYTKPRKAKQKDQTKQDKIEKLLEQIETLNPRNTKRTKAASRIGIFFRNTTKFKMSSNAAFKDNVLKIMIQPFKTGTAMTTDITAYIARSYLLARKQIPRNATFKLNASCEFEILDNAQ